MPELPEVETIRRGLERLLSGKRFSRVDIADDRVLIGFRPDGAPRRAVDIPAFQAALVGASIKNVSRRGKYLIFRLSSGSSLICHLRMTGQLLYGPPHEAYRARFHFENDDNVLSFCDARRFGEIILSADPLREPGLASLGPEPMTNGWDREEWERELRTSRAKIQSALLDQKRIAGVGNIYAAEALFYAGIRPTRRCHTLRKEQARRILSAVRRVLATGLRHRGVSFYSYRDVDGQKGDALRRLAVYGRDGQPCRRCRSVLKAIKISGRGTVYCPRCQE